MAPKLLGGHILRPTRGQGPILRSFLTNIDYPEGGIDPGGMANLIGPNFLIGLASRCLLNKILVFIALKMVHFFGNSKMWVQIKVRDCVKQ